MTSSSADLVVESRPAVGAGATRRMIRRFRRQGAPMVALTFLVLLAVASFATPLIAPYDPLEQDLRAFLQGPSAAHWFGTDQLGRDVLSRLLDGGRISITGAAQALFVALVIAVPLGLLSGYLSGLFDKVVMRITDALMSIPPLIMMMAMVAALGPNLTNAMIALGVVFVPRFLRLIRAVVLELREEPYVEAARSVGVSTTGIIVRHIVPNAMPPLIVQVAMATGFAILAEASLSFLGLGVQPPQPSWGSMLSDGFANLGATDTLIVFPGVIIALTVLAANVVGDGLRESIGREVRSE